jgi:hypothetical protein
MPGKKLKVKVAAAIVNRDGTHLTPAVDFKLTMTKKGFTNKKKIEFPSCHAGSLIATDVHVLNPEGVVIYTAPIRAIKIRAKKQKTRITPRALRITEN